MENTFDLEFFVISNSRRWFLGFCTRHFLPRPSTKNWYRSDKNGIFLQLIEEIIIAVTFDARTSIWMCHKSQVWCTFFGSQEMSLQNNWKLMFLKTVSKQLLSLILSSWTSSRYLVYLQLNLDEPYGLWSLNHDLLLNYLIFLKLNMVKIEHSIWTKEFHVHNKGNSFVHLNKYALRRIFPQNYVLSLISLKSNQISI